MAESSPPLEPVPFWWVVQYADQGIRELWTWGRRYRSDDGSTRELRLLRLSGVVARPRSQPEIAVAAYTAASYQHPLVGPLTLDSQQFDVSGKSDQHLVVFTAEPDSSSHEALKLLAQWTNTPVA
ncbi:hypothetical protein [Plantactinospora sp. B5E13]|uniref:MmyB family transcriptional regulator n=1 Tax=Plantactinospora sp. B5E13 TaxID=3153758 RepID=UPI00325C7824